MGSQVKLTDAEKTRRLAEGCMGWTYSRADKHHHAAWNTTDGGYLRVDVWQPLHNESHAAEVRERMRELGYILALYAHPHFHTVLWTNEKDRSKMAAWGLGSPSVSSSICHAVLLALGLAKEEEL